MANIRNFANQIQQAYTTQDEGAFSRLVTIDISSPTVNSLAQDLQHVKKKEESLIHCTSIHKYTISIDKWGPSTRHYQWRAWRHFLCISRSYEQLHGSRSLFNRNWYWFCVWNVCKLLQVCKEASYRMILESNDICIDHWYLYSMDLIHFIWCPSLNHFQHRLYN